MPNPQYEAKFAGFIQLCAGAEHSEFKVVIVSHPSALGDTYEELIESLSRLADAKLTLAIASR